MNYKLCLLMGIWSRLLQYIGKRGYKFVYKSLKLKCFIKCKTISIKIKILMDWSWTETLTIYFCYFLSFAKTKSSIEQRKNYYFLVTHFVKKIMRDFLIQRASRPKLYISPKLGTRNRRLWKKSKSVSICSVARKESFVWVLSHTD